MEMKNPYREQSGEAAPINTGPQAYAQPVEPVKRKRFNNVLAGDKKRWLIPLVVVVVIALGVYLVLQYRGGEKRWSAATDYFNKAQYDQAAEQLKDVSMPTDEKRLGIYAQTMLATRQLDKALPAYEALYKKNKSPDTLVRIGNIYNEQQKYDKAIETYQAVINANHGYVQAYVNLATVQRLQNRPEAAAATAKKGVEANPGSIVMHELYVSMLLEKQDSAEYKAAVAALRKLNPEDPLLVSLEQ